MLLKPFRYSFKETKEASSSQANPTPPQPSVESQQLQHHAALHSALNHNNQLVAVNALSSNVPFQLTNFGGQAQIVAAAPQMAQFAASPQQVIISNNIVPGIQNTMQSSYFNPIQQIPQPATSIMYMPPQPATPQPVTSFMYMPPPTAPQRPGVIHLAPRNATPIGNQVQVQLSQMQLQQIVLNQSATTTAASVAVASLPQPPIASTSTNLQP